MYKNHVIAVIIPCHNEESRIGHVLDTVPDFVDHVLVVDDGSRDRTPEIVERAMEKNPRVKIIRHEVNQGVGGALASGYQWARDNGASIAAVMAGDGQMDPRDLPAILDPVADGEADFCKGNRFTRRVSLSRIPRLRLAGNVVLSFLTRLITGLRDLDDTQNGYTAAGRKVLETIAWDAMYKGYGQPNDLLVKLSLRRFRISQVPNEAIYHRGSPSGMNPLKVIWPISRLMLRLALEKRRHEAGSAAAQKPVKGRNERRWILFAAGSLLIVLLQCVNFSGRFQLDPSYSLKKISGLYTGAFQNFFYFFYYTGYFPVTDKKGRFTYDKASAERRLEPGRGKDLSTEDKHAIRGGDLGKIFLFWPDALLKGAPVNPSVVPFNALLFNAALLLTFGFFLYSGLGWTGMLLALAAGSDPFLLFENYAHVNVFGEFGSLTLLLLAFHLPQIMGKAPRFWLRLLPVLSALLLAFFKQVRPEFSALIVSVLIVYLFAPRCSVRLRVFQITVFLLFFTVSLSSWEKFWEVKYSEAARKVEAAGGTPYTGKRYQYHRVWHPLWCGLGDFGRKYGYAWSDGAAHAYALPLLNEKLGKNFTLTENHYLAQYYEGSRYLIKPEDLDEYLVILREKIVHDILRDPLWYAGVLAKRTARIFMEAPPLRFGVVNHFITIPFASFLALPVVLLLLLRGGRRKILIIAFTVPASFPALLVFSGEGQTLYSLFHLAAFALIPCLFSDRSGRREPAGEVPGSAA